MGMDDYRLCLLGMGLSAFFWLPALVEHPLLQWVDRVPNHMPSPWRNCLYRSNRSISANSCLTPQLTLGLPLILFTAAGCGLVLIVTRGNMYAPISSLFADIGTVLIAAALTRFPHEHWLLGLVSMCLAVTSSARLWSAQVRLPSPNAAPLSRGGTDRRPDDLAARCCSCHAGPPH